MRRRARTNGAALAAAAAVVAALAASCRSTTAVRPVRPAVATPSPALLAPPALEAYVAAPRLRVGIVTDAARVSIGADGELTVWATAPGQAEPRRSVVQRATLLGQATPSASSGSLFRVQVASLAEEAAAGEAAAAAREASGLTPTVRYSGDTRTFQVRVGSFATREEAKALAAQLGRAGFGGAWVTEEPAPATEAGRMRLVETAEELGVATLYPSAPGALLEVDGSRYRGLIEVRANGSGTLTVVNVVNLEDYLRGVVPNELSPRAFPHLEALKAQAVAARTYAVRNRGQFEAKGYDICATPACQVYRGQSSEDALSDQAVIETRGLVARYHGAPINALYTSTCGGHTEDGDAMFEGGQSTPYLKGVVCAPERSAWSTIRTAAAPLSLGEEAGLNRDAALLSALGVLDSRLPTTAAVKAAASPSELRSWTGRLLAALHRRGCQADLDGDVARRGTYFRYLVGSLCWDERGRRLLSPQDPDYLLQVEDRAQLDGDAERVAAALLLQEGVLTPFPDNTLRADARVTRGQAITLLARAAERAGAPDQVSAEFRGAAAGEMTVKRGEATEALPLDPKLRLFRAFDASRLAASEVTLSAGDKVSYVVRDGRVVFLEAQQSRLGAAADRSSKYYRWEVRLTPAEVAQAAARYGHVGPVRDVVARRLGVSGRVIELGVLGNGGETLLKGLKIRWALGLRENLFVIDRERDERGQVQRFVFTGKGWGHGVGLCQVGAYGMALSGARYSEILAHYYTGITLDPSD